MGVLAFMQKLGKHPEIGIDTKPEWLRLPKPGRRCQLTGLSRTTLNELTIPGTANDYRPPVKSVLLKKRGAVRGIRLISYDSLMGFLDTEAEKQVLQASMSTQT